MRTAQLIQVTAAFALVAAVGCNRADTRDQTQRAADDVKNAATRAGHTIGSELADGWLTTRIQSQYFADDQVKARYIDVTSNDGVVTIKGFVETPAAHERALQIARATSGVRQVNDQILIGQSPQAFETAPRPVATSGNQAATSPAAAPIDDDRLTSTVQAAFYLDPTIKARQITVDARNGIVTLKGEVASEAERAQALVLARNAQGVQRVEDNLSVNAALGTSGPAAAASGPVFDDSALTASVRTKFESDPQLKTVTVNVADGVAQLQGTVPSKAAHERAISVASETDGVRQVIDRLTITRR